MEILECFNELKAAQEASIASLERVHQNKIEAFEIESRVRKESSAIERLQQELSATCARHESEVKLLVAVKEQQGLLLLEAEEVRSRLQRTQEAYSSAVQAGPPLTIGASSSSSITAGGLDLCSLSQELAGKVCLRDPPGPETHLPPASSSFSKQLLSADGPTSLPPQRNSAPEYTSQVPAPLAATTCSSSSSALPCPPPPAPPAAPLTSAQHALASFNSAHAQDPPSHITSLRPAAAATATTTTARFSPPKQETSLYDQMRESIREQTVHDQMRVSLGLPPLGAAGAGGGAPLPLPVTVIKSHNSLHNPAGTISQQFLKKGKKGGKAGKQAGGKQAKQAGGKTTSCSPVKGKAPGSLQCGVREVSEHLEARPPWQPAPGGLAHTTHPREDTTTATTTFAPHSPQHHRMVQFGVNEKFGMAPEQVEEILSSPEQEKLGTAAHLRMLDTLGLGNNKRPTSPRPPHAQPGEDKEEEAEEPSSVAATESLLTGAVSVMRQPRSAAASDQLLSTAAPWVTSAVPNLGPSKRDNKPTWEDQSLVHNQHQHHHQLTKKMKANVAKLHKMCDTLGEAVGQQWAAEAGSVAEGSDSMAEGMRALWKWYQDDKQGLLQVVNMPDTRCITPLHKAIMMDDPTARLVQFLLHAGADANVADEEGNTPLIIAGFFDNSANGVSRLIQAGADVNMQGSEGNTALITAAEGLNEPVIALLVDAGADITLKNSNGQTALDLAQQNNNRDTLMSVKASCLAYLQPDLEPEEVDDLILKALV